MINLGYVIIFFLLTFIIQIFIVQTVHYFMQCTRGFMFGFLFCPYTITIPLSNLQFLTISADVKLFRT